MRVHNRMDQHPREETLDLVAKDKLQNRPSQQAKKELRRQVLGSEVASR